MNSTCQFAASDEHLSEPLAVSAACFSSMGLLCCVQMYFLIGITFRRRSGLYFWSLVGATSAQLLICFSIILKNWIIRDRLTGIPVAMSTIGFLFFPPFEFLVLYSRLHLLQASNRVLKFALIITFLEWFLAELPMALVGVLLAIYPNSNKISQVNIFWWEFEEALYPTVDFILCFLYFLHAKRMWGHSEDKMKWVLRHIVLMSSLLILIDVSYLILTNLMNWDWADAAETFPFALKLHIEIYTLNMLTEISSKNHTQAHEKFGLDTSNITQNSINQDWAISDSQDIKEPQSLSEDTQMSGSESRKRLQGGSIDYSYP